MIWPFQSRKDTCPCCGFQSLDDVSPGSHFICEICFWEDDPVQFEDPDFEGGANTVSLRQAQRNFAVFGWTERRFREHVRPPTERDRMDPDWHPFEEAD